MERGVELGYLRRLDQAYAEFFASYDGAPVFSVDTEGFNPADHERDFSALVDRLSAFRGRRVITWALRPKRRCAEGNGCQDRSARAGAASAAVGLRLDCLLLIGEAASTPRPQPTLQMNR